MVLGTPAVPRISSPVPRVYQLAGWEARIWGALERQAAEGQRELRSWDSIVPESLRLAKQAAKRVARSCCRGGGGRGVFFIL